MKLLLIILAAFSVRVLADDDSSGGDSAEANLEAVMDELDLNLGRDYAIALAGFVLMMAVYRIVINVIQHTRTLACLSNDTQRYFAIPNTDWINFKSYILYAPLFRNRHNREFRFSSALNLGTLPTRFQAIFLTTILVANVTLCVYGIPWSNSAAEVRSILMDRTGTLSVVNLIPVMLLSSPKNPLIKILNVSFDSMNIMHRNFARLAILQAIAHTVCYIVGKVQTSGWSSFATALTTDNMIYTGAISTLALVIISCQSLSAVRHAFYEFFLHFHVALIILMLAFLWMHLEGLPQLYYLLAAILVWACLRLLRFFSFFRYNFGRGGTKAVIEILPGDALRVSVTSPRNVNAFPGSHMYLCIPSVGLWTSHPFSIAWSDVEVSSGRMTPDSVYDEKIRVHSDPDPRGRQILGTIIRRRTGFTDSLYKKVEKAGASEGAKLTVKAYIDAGYGLKQSVLYSCGTVMLFAGGVGITHQLPYVKYLIDGFTNKTVAAKKVILVWITQSPEHLEWIRPWMTEILSMEKRREVLTIKLFITRPRSAKEISSPSATVQMFPGRPNIEVLIEKECESQIGCMGVSVCGPGDMADSVRSVVRQQTSRNIEFVEESFTW